MHPGCLPYELHINTGTRFPLEQLAKLSSPPQQVLQCTGALRFLW